MDNSKYRALKYHTLDGKPGETEVIPTKPCAIAEDKYQFMHLELFNHGIVHAECMGGDIYLLLNSRCQVGCFSWKFVDGESSIAWIVAFVEDDRYEKLMAKKAKCELPKFGDIDGSKDAWLHEEAKKK